MNDAAHRDLYEVLGVPKSATSLEIKAAYRSLMLRHHPDKATSEPAAYDAAAINAAFDTLLDPHKRHTYDQQLQAAFAAQRDKQGYARTFDLSDFTPHYQWDDNTDEPAYFSHDCRCSGAFIISTEQLQDGVDLIQCDSCSERCKVEYEMVAD